MLNKINNIFLKLINNTRRKKNKNIKVLDSKELYTLDRLKEILKVTRSLSEISLLKLA